MMNKELDEKLVAKYPKIFKNRHGSPKNTLMCFGFEIGDGWYNIIDCACALIQNHIDSGRDFKARALKYNRALRKTLAGDSSALIKYYAGKVPSEKAMQWATKSALDDLKEPRFRKVYEECPQVVAVQIKEKFGGLRFYYNGGDSTVKGIVAMAEAMSYRTCEVCGNVGEQRGGGWIRVLCDEHSN